MLEWYNKSLVYDDMPDHIDAYLVGIAKPLLGKLHVELIVKFTRLSETIKIIWKTKDQKIWPANKLYDIDETALVEMYGSWIDRFNKNTKSFKSLVLKAASKSTGGVTTWVLSLIDIVKRGD